MARAPRPERGWSTATNRATSSGQPTSASLVRGDARVPGSTAPGMGRDPACRSGATKSLQGGEQLTGLQRQRSLGKRRQKAVERRARESRAYGSGAKATESTREPGAGAQELSGVMGVE